MLAEEQIDGVSRLVQNKLGVVSGWATQARIAAEQAIAGIGTFDPPQITMALPGAPNLASPSLPDMSPPPESTVENAPVAVGYVETGQVGFTEPDAIPPAVYGAPIGLKTRPSYKVPQPDTGYPHVDIPQIPARDRLGSPDVPTILQPEPMTLLPINMPAFKFDHVDSFDPATVFVQPVPSLGAPEHSGETLVDVVEATEEYSAARIVPENTQVFVTPHEDSGVVGDIPQYYPPLKPYTPAKTEVRHEHHELIARIEQLRKGFTNGEEIELLVGNTPVRLVLTTDMVLLRNRMVDSMVSEVDRAAQKVASDAFVQAAAQNFSLPSGALVDAVNTTRSDAERKIREEMSKVNTELGKQALENYTTALGEAIALEKRLIDLELEKVRQLLTVERLAVKAQIEMFDAVVALYNTQQGVRSRYDEAYKTQLRSLLTIKGLYPAVIEGAIAETAEDDARMAMYSADAKLVLSEAEIFKSTTQKYAAEIDTYKSEVGGIKTQADIMLANLEAYRSALQAYSAGVEATFLDVQAFATETQAKSSEVEVVEANARAFATFAQENVKRAQAFRAYAAAQGDIVRANVQTFNAASETNTAYVRALAAKVSAQAEIESARASAYSNNARAVSAYNQAGVNVDAATQQYALTAAENAARAQSLAAMAQAETDRVNAGAIAAKTQAVAGLAQGSMSALHVSAATEGSGAVTSSGSHQVGLDASYGGSTTYSESKIQRATA